MVTVPTRVKIIKLENIKIRIFDHLAVQFYGKSTVCSQIRFKSRKQAHLLIT